MDDASRDRSRSRDASTGDPTLAHDGQESDTDESLSSAAEERHEERRHRGERSPPRPEEAEGTSEAPAAEAPEVKKDPEAPRPRGMRAGKKMQKRRNNAQARADKGLYMAPSMAAEKYGLCPPRDPAELKRIHERQKQAEEHNAWLRASRAEWKA